MKYLSIYCNDTQSYLETGLNSTSYKELIESYKSLDVDLPNNANDEDVLQTLYNLGYTIEEHSEIKKDNNELWFGDDWL